MRVIGAGAAIATQQLATVLADSAEFHVLVVVVRRAWKIRITIVCLSFRRRVDTRGELVSGKKQGVGSQVQRDTCNTFSFAMRAAPFPFGRLLELRLQAYQVICSGTRIAQDDLAALLTHLAVILMISL